MSRRNWKRIQPTSLRDGLVLCKDFARERHQLSVERIADLMGVGSDLLYKWLGTGRMPACLIPTYELVCRCNFVTRWLAASSGLLLVSMPKGRVGTPDDIHQLQTLLNAATGSLIDFYKGGRDVEPTLADIRNALESLAWHHGNVAQHNTPQLDLGEDE